MSEYGHIGPKTAWVLRILGIVMVMPLGAAGIVLGFVLGGIFCGAWEGYHMVAYWYTWLRDDQRGET